ncbi:MAG TPA: hypothetical protein VMY37_00305 [Thermoguttaceae bacterium]|nr:hypothetical protein [Thermoguttaceae bacterium]
MRVRFSLRQLMAFVAFVAVGCGGLIRPSVYLASLIFTATLVMLLVAILAAVGRKGSARVFWIGFAIAGSGYLWLAHWADEESYTVSTDWRLQTTGPLFTTKLLRLAHGALHPAPQGYPAGTGFFALPLEPALAPVFGQMGVRSPRPTPAAAATYETELDAFMRIGHSLWALLFAYLGGQLARYFRATTEVSTDRRNE